MYKSYQLIDLLKSRLNLNTDADAAKKLSVSRSAICRYRREKGSMDDVLAVTVAEYLALPPLTVLASMRCERAQRNNEEETLKFWQKYLQ